MIHRIKIEWDSEKGQVSADFPADKIIALGMLELATFMVCNKKEEPRHILQPAISLIQ